MKYDSLSKQPLGETVVSLDNESLSKEEEIELHPANYNTTVNSTTSFLPNHHSAIHRRMSKRHRLDRSKKMKKRIVMKNGDVNVKLNNVSKESHRFLADIFTTLVDSKWRYTLLVFSLSFILEWLGFAILWWLIAYSHGDLEPENLPPNQQDSGWKPCVKEIHNFASCFLFSVETQHTIGYGYRHATEECTEGVLLLCLQSILGIMSQAFMVGVVFAKLARPTKRTETVLFSRSAVVACRDSRLCLMFRVGDLRKTRVIEAHVRAQLIRKRFTREGELIPFEQLELKLGFDGEEDRLMLFWPTVIVHRIDSASPMYEMSAFDVLREKFEILVTLEGISESTSTSLQARSSYLPCEIQWGRRFESLVAYKGDTNEFQVDMKQFNRTYEVETPHCSASELDRYLRKMDAATATLGVAEDPEQQGGNEKRGDGGKDNEVDLYAIFPRSSSLSMLPSGAMPDTSDDAYALMTSSKRSGLVMTSGYAAFSGTWRIQNKWDSEPIF